MEKISNIFKTIFSQEDLPRVRKALENIFKAGGKAYLVGGAVRDLLLNKKIKDVDIEVHLISLEKLSEILSKFGIVNFVGKSFGVLKWEHSQIDWGIPRKDFAGRKPKVNLNPEMGIKDALSRRDLTINAMAIDLDSKKLIDPFNGQKDLKDHIARSPDPKFFTEDPLRFYRVMQFIGRFDLTPDRELNEICKKMDIQKISNERIYSEFDKLFLKSKMPSKGIRWIYKLNRLKEVLPELGDIECVLQETKWHPEGDVFEHSMQTLDAAATFKYKIPEEKLTLLSAALCHDIGKGDATFIENNKIRSIGHSTAGLKKVRSLMHRITNNKKRIKIVEKLVEFHMEPLTFIDSNASDNAYHRLAIKLYPMANLYLLSMLAMADHMGRNPKRGKPLKEKSKEVLTFERRAKKLGIFYHPEVPILSGKDIDCISPGPILGKALKKAYDIQVFEKIKDKDILKKRICKEFAK